jgi:hypothetical protein
MRAALIDDIEQKKAQLDRLRPLSGAALAQLQKHYDVELTYTSNAIEGNTLTLRETAEVIEHGITVAGKSLRDHLEAVDHYAAVQWVRALAAAATPLDEGPYANCIVALSCGASRRSPESTAVCRDALRARLRYFQTRPRFRN